MWQRKGLINPTTVVLLKEDRCQQHERNKKKQDRSDLAYLEILGMQMSGTTFILSGGECNLINFNSLIEH